MTGTVDSLVHFVGHRSEDRLLKRASAAHDDQIDLFGLDITQDFFVVGAGHHGRLGDVDAL
jgi:hypothetical protein